MLKIAVLLALLVFTAAIIGGNVSSSIPPKNKQEASQTEGSKTETEISNSEPALSWWQLWRRTWADPVAFYTFVLALFSGGLLVVAGLQIWLLLRAEDVSRLAARAADESANVARQSLEATQRAFLFVGSFSVQAFNNAVVIQPSWENSGSSPTVRMHTKTNWKLFSGDPPDDFDYPNFDDNGNVTTAPETGAACRS